MVESRKLLTLCILCLGLNSKAQVSAENYIQTTERISSTQFLSTTEYYDGLGRPFEKVEHKKTPDGGNLIHLQQYDGLGRDWKIGSSSEKGYKFCFISYDINNLSRQKLYNDGRKANYVYDAEGNKHSVQYTLTAMTNTLPQMAVMQSSNAASANSTNGQKVIN